MQSSSTGSRLVSLLNPVTIIKSIYARHDLLLQIVRRQIELDFKGSYLGVAWTVLEPLLILAIYALVFGVFLGARFMGHQQESGFEFAMALFLGLAIFNLLSDVFGRAPTAITAVPNYVKKVVFPVELLPLAVVLTSVTRFLISLGLLVLALLISGVAFKLSSMLLLVVMMPVFLLSIGLAWLLAALGVFVRDVAKTMKLVSLVLLYGSAIFYPPTLIREKGGLAWSILEWNPILQAVDMARRVMLWDMPLDTGKLLYLYVLGILVFVSGYAFFMAVRPAFSDVVR